jgi:hypothetical protein
MKNILCIILLLTSSRIHAQDWFSDSPLHSQADGYIITIAGDTISGTVQFDFPVVMQKRLVFTASNGQGPVTYQPEDIRGYSAGSMNWESIVAIFATYDGQVKFNRFGIQYSGYDPIHLYRIFPEKDKIKKNLSSARAETIYKGISLQHDMNTFDHLYLKKSENPAIDVNDRTFKKNFQTVMSGLVSDHANLVKMIRSRQYGYRDLNKIISEYNNWYLDKVYKR